MSKFYNNLVFKPWSEGGEKNLIGELSFDAPNDFYSSDDIDTPIAEISKLKKNIRGRHIYAEDYPVYRKDRLLVNKSEYLQMFIDIENLGGLYQKNVTPIDNYIITVCSINLNGRAYQLKLEDYQSEDQFLEALGKIITHSGSIVSGWNIGYDIDLIRDRYLFVCKKQLNFTNPVIDYMSLYRHYVANREQSFKLDYILRKNGLPGKVPYDGTLDMLYRENRELYYTYNLRDTACLYELEQKLGLFKLCQHIIDITGCLWQDMVHNSHIINALMYKWLTAHGQVFRNKRDVPRADYEGAFVYDPVPGIYSELFCFDFSSLYPSLILEWNIGPDTLVSSGGLVTPVGTRYRQDYKSFIATIEEELLNERKNRKAAGDHTGQWAFKILANSIYGLFGNPGFRFCDPDIARTITGCARHINRYIGSHISDAFLTIGEKSAVVAGDTDSIYVNASKLRMALKGAHLETLINEILIPQYAKEFGISGKRLSMKNEYGQIKGIFLKEKKMYCLSIPGEDEPVIKGLIKSDKVPRANELLKKVVALVFDGQISTVNDINLIEMGVRRSFHLSPDWLVPYRINKRLQDYEKKENWMGGLELLDKIYEYDGDRSRGVLVQLLGAPRTARCKNPEKFTLAIPEDLYPMIQTIVDMAGTEMGLKVDTEYHCSMVLKGVEYLKEVLV